MEGGLKENGQYKTFKGYGGIEAPDIYINSQFGEGWGLRLDKGVNDIDAFRQSTFGPDNDNNCTLASIARVMKYYAGRGYHGIPDDIYEIYKKVREIGVKHGYDPNKSGIMRDLFVYTPFEINTMVKESWKIFYNSSVSSSNRYFRKINIIVENIDNENPPLLNIASGDYKGHTVTVTGYRIYEKAGKPDRALVRVYDGWSEAVRYIDWKRFGNTPASVTTIVPR